MQFFDARNIAENLPYEELVDALDEAFRGDATVPLRTHHTIPGADDGDATLLLMPAWRSGGGLGVKVASVFPQNAARGEPAVNASYLLLDGETGKPVALMDGGELTLRRTACASALASRYLSAESARTLLMVGTGSLAPHLVAAHVSVRPFTRVLIWGRNNDKATALRDRLGAVAGSVETAGDLETAVREADVISCATLATEPLIAGAWLRPGQHVDLVGAFTPDMREADSGAVGRARIYVDTYAGTLKEAGDILQPLREGVIQESDIVGELADLARGLDPGRRGDDEITLFKSVGTALEDLAAAELVIAANTP